MKTIATIGFHLVIVSMGSQMNPHNKPSVWLGTCLTWKCTFLFIAVSIRHWSWNRNKWSHSWDNFSWITQQVFVYLKDIIFRFLHTNTTHDSFVLCIYKAQVKGRRRLIYQLTQSGRKWANLSFCFLFYSSPQWVGWCLSILGRKIYFAESADSNANLFVKTEKSCLVGAPHGSVKFKHKINIHNYWDSTLLDIGSCCFGSSI